ncbi:hypothetical protein [Ottowia sp. SB7-C50]|uniref:hypothetical protein n=1 Tax=Ottowia sp. SB7-C50 TaxID=3081231 RepID=UPI0029553B84|nr:hypothetical protein [Ottowia sp. SB7-C50]WOP14509.1 hypothetical protein R0D99_11660 [Ottowia sp. SB7-C50]
MDNQNLPQTVKIEQSGRFIAETDFTDMPKPQPKPDAMELANRAAVAMHGAVLKTLAQKDERTGDEAIDNGRFFCYFDYTTWEAHARPLRRAAFVRTVEQLIKDIPLAQDFWLDCDQLERLHQAVLQRMENRRQAQAEVAKWRARGKMPDQVSTN